MLQIKQSSLLGLTNSENDINMFFFSTVIGFSQREYTLEERPHPHRLQVQPVRGFLPQDMALTVTAMAGTACMMVTSPALRLKVDYEN